MHKRNQISPLSGFIFAKYLSFIHVFILMAFIGVERACFGLCVCVSLTSEISMKRTSPNMPNDARHTMEMAIVNGKLFL